MKFATATEAIHPDALRVGMFVHLGVGWMSHPFPLSSFRIASATQLATIRSLGLKNLRWDPEQSDLEPAAGTLHADETAPGRAEPGAPPSVAPSTAPSAALSTPLAERALQREALAMCERQFAEATTATRQIFETIPAQPQRAAEHAQAMSRALVDKMLGSQDLCIRLLNEAAGDKGSAHAVNVAIISLLMGRSFGFSEADMLDLGVGAMLHDVGKLDLPERLRHRDENFSASEHRGYEDHVARGVLLARKMGLAPGATLVVAQHHEHADGSGFPLGIGSDRMTMAARIVALVNRYDSLCNPQLAGNAVTPHEAVSLLFAQGQDKFDTAILAAFIKMMGVYPPGSAVQLTDDRFALVVGVNSSRPLRPRVLVHDPRVPRDEALILNLETAAGVGIRRSLRPQAMPRASLEYLAPRGRVLYFFEAAPEAVSA